MYNQNTIKAPPYHQNPEAMNLKYDLNHITKTETADGLDTICPCHIYDNEL